ncbi:TPA_asm: hypothetical protein GZX72_14665, partial [Listeria monocytogenes]|nr:hypothetical protein [Listeria monocytogenes]
MYTKKLLINEIDKLSQKYNLSLKMLEFKFSKEESTIKHEDIDRDIKYGLKKPTVYGLLENGNNNSLGEFKKYLNKLGDDNIIALHVELNSHHANNISQAATLIKKEQDNIMKAKQELKKIFANSKILIFIDNIEGPLDIIPNCDNSGIIIDILKISFRNLIKESSIFINIPYQKIATIEEND